ncbi:MAG: SMI1/KNR4 family protein [Candidatus Rokubacteria bacterium]|nr:SMI1/KNR4 family protein [Candidatus Rokubacteria bacterium]
MLLDIEALLVRLVLKWSSAGLTIRPGAEEAALRDFERLHGVSLPEDFRLYLATVDGMHEMEWDSDLIHFWRLEEMRSLLEEISKVEDPEPLRGFFVFADHSIWAHGYAIRLTSDYDDAGRVVLVHSRIGTIAHSFTEFLQLYLDAPGDLFLA